MAAAPASNRFEVIDLYRGFGSICIFISHGAPFMGGLLLPQAYLALDVFFVMSGFVIANGFDAAIARGMPLQRFLALRIIRFYPAYIAALLLTVPLAMFYVGHNGHPYSLRELGIALAPALFMLPSSVDPLGLDRLYPLNGVCWSLFFELVVNLIYFLVFPLLSKRGLLAAMAISATGLVLARLYHGSMNMGFSLSDAILALPKLSFAFFMGVFLRRHCYERLNFCPGPGTAIASIAAMLILFRHGEYTGGTPTLALDLLAVFIVFPAIVLFSAGLPRQAALATLGRWSGRFSYPMYLFQDASFMVFAASFQLLFQLKAKVFAPWITLPLLAMAIVVALAADRWLEPWGAKQLRKLLLPAKPAPDAKPINTV